MADSIDGQGTSLSDGQGGTADMCNNCPPESGPLTEAELGALARVPKRTTGDEGTVEERSAEDLIRLSTYGAAPCKPPFGMCVARVSPRGTV